MTDHTSTATIRDVMPRDGLQAEAPLAAAIRANLAIALADAGLAHVEAASFVSQKAVPSMAGGDEVFGQLPKRQTVWWALVPNAQGARAAMDAGVTSITVTVSASTAYSEKNVRRSTAAAIAGLADIAAVTGQDGIVVDIVVSCAFGSPFDDVTNPAPVVAVVEGAQHAMPGARITLADTTGTATPRRIAEVLGALPDSACVDLGLHLHDTRGTALANALWAVEHGIRRFDTATGGLGGSPFAPGAGGNLATEDLVLVLDDLGISTGIDLDIILRIARSLPALIGHAVPSRTSAAGSLPRFDSVSIAEARGLTRREELLVIAADQFAAFGFHSVTVDDIGRAAGISGPALYHHFAGKEALLGEMLVSISQQLLDGGRRLAESQPPDLLEQLILFHCQFAVDNRSLITVHFRDLIHASIADGRRVRRLQATYALLWTNTVIARNLGVGERTARAAVHATFGLINSTPFSSTLPRAAMIDLLSAMSSSALGGLR